MNCPDCGNTMKKLQTTCMCGWKPEQNEAKDYQCNGMIGIKRCQAEGTMSHNIRGGGPWYCINCFNK